MIVKCKIQTSRQDLKKGLVLPEKTSCDLAEFLGILIGDGCITNASGRYFVEIVGSPIYDKEYLTEYVAPLIEKLFSKKPTVRHRERGIRVKISSKEIFEFLVNVVGLDYGFGKCYRVRIPESLVDNWGLVKHTLRGISDTDGSLFISDKPGCLNYPSLEITTASVGLINQIYSILLKQNFRPTIRSFTPPKGARIYKLGLYGHKMVYKWFAEIGFSNPSKIRKYQEIVRRAGFEPATPRSSA